VRPRQKILRPYSFHLYRYLLPEHPLEARIRQRLGGQSRCLQGTAIRLSQDAGLGDCARDLSADPECATPLSFNETQPGGKALFASLTVALINKRKVGLRYDGCDIIEVYLK
jgi:hypothetical protein